MCRGYFYFCTLAVILALCSTNQVSALKCIKCDSDFDGEDCKTNANQTRFTVECSEHSFIPTSERQNNNPATGRYDCGYARGVSTETNKTRVVRGCAIITTTCNTYSDIYKADHQIKVNACKRCDSDLCNSSGPLKTGFWSLSLCLLALYFMKL